ncbi:nucleoporin subcomplex protein binding to Pom34-domain-containing protein [Mucor mucedo]|uniref:nucleoporin subcomplex protein binding to Pom34-domain-containing protein n=1 Tax=Mucor mucedo TaxID=29922 RepID=UPI00221FB65C|nr:nucleoporin subcomplex protein binding to Pom34-domain-containing protein [Mucor mucedo]KAI7893866.1 nucleoporin subcomplex protein binding to Pom34-domain-containing protein [Mucor mucedo]
MVQNDQDEKFAGTYRKLFDTIERGVEQCSTDRLQTLLEEKKEHLKLGLEAFGEASSQSRSKVTSGSSVAVDGKTIKLEQKEKDLIIKLSDITNLNEVQCAQLWEAFRQENKDSVTRFNDSEQALSENIELIMNVVNFYYEDRISLLECIGSLQRIAFDGSHPYSTIATDTLQKLRDINSSTPLPQRLFAQYASLVRSNVPNRTYSFPGWASVWAKQNLREQKALLEIIFLFSVGKTFEPTFIFSIIQEFESDCFGVLQTFGYVLDDEGLKLRRGVTHVCTLLSINLILSPEITTETKLSTTDKDLINTPDVIAKINQVVLYLGDRHEHAPFLLAWSYFVTCLDCILNGDDTTSVPESYKQIQPIINGTQSVSTSGILKTRPMVNGTDFEEARQISIQQKPNMDRIFLGRSLKLDVFGVVTDILESEVCSEEDVNNYGYRSVLRTLFKAFLSTTRPYYIPTDSYATLIKAYCLIYKNQAALCEAFWNDDYVKDDPYTLLATARGRFPVFFTDLTRLLSALSGGANDDVDGKAAENVFGYLCQVPSITVELGNNVQITAVEENGRAVINANQNIRVTQELQTIASIEILEGTQGLLLSSSEDYSLVQFPLPYSGWHLLTAVLAGFMNPSGSGIDIKDEDESLKGNNIETIDSILDLLYNVLLNNPKLVPSLVQHIESAARIPGQSTGTPIIISVICNILSSCSRVQPCPIPTMTLSLQCLTLLIPHYRNDIWSYLQAAPILPRPNVNIPLSTRLATSSFVINPAAQIQQIVSRVECTTDMVQGLVRDVQRNWWVNANEGSVPNRQYQVDVLYLCLHYLMLDVFPSYASWRYKKVSERFLIGTKVIEIFTEIARGFKEPVSAQQSRLSLNGIRTGIFNNFLYEGGVYHISPLLDTISEGAETANILYKINHPKEAAKVEKLTEMTFVFVKILLQYRLEQINEGSTTMDESTLERLLLERTTGNNCSDFLLRIVKHINYRHNIALQIEATNVLFLLCRTVSFWKSTPNFVQYLGNTDQVHKIIRAYLDIAKDHFQSEVLLSAIWRLMTAFLETQPSLAILFLECGDFILPSPKSAVRLLAGQKSAPAAPTPAPTESAVRAAIDVLGHWETLLVQKPTVVSNVLRFIATFWQTAFDHYALVERTRSDNALWDSLGKILLNPNSEIDTGSHLQQQDLMDTDDLSTISQNDLSVRRLCCLNLSKAFVMRILSYEIHLTAGNERALGNNTTNVLDKLPAGLKNLMNKINEPTKLTQMRQAYVKNDFDPSVSQKAISSAEDLLQSIGIIDNTSVLLLKMESTGGCGDDGSAGEARQYGDSYLYDYRMAETRVHTLFKDIISKYGFTNLDNIIVTPEVQAVLDIKQYSNKFLKSVLEVNYNGSVVDSQIILLRSFKTFIEASSNRVSDLIWANKSSLQGSASLHAFLMGLIKNASEEEREDGVTLTSYSVLMQFIRGLTEDWINKNVIILTGIDVAAKKDYATKAFELLSCLCGLLNRENFAIMKSITDYTAIRFHRPLLESVMLCLRTLGPVVRNLSTVEKDFQSCLEKLLNVVCQSFRVLVIKAGSYSAAESLVPEFVAESCIKDVTVVISLLQDLISPKYRLDIVAWRTSLQSNETIRSALNLFFGGVELVVNEVDSQCATNGIYSLSITPYAESALYFLLELSNIPQGANELILNNIYDCFRNNRLTTRLQEGKLDLFIRFGDGSKVGPAYVERNPLHNIWCQMLGIVNNLNRHHGASQNVFNETVNFLQIYSPQIGKAFANANGANDSMFGLIPNESLSTPLLEEIERINMVFFGLSKHYQRHRLSEIKVENLFMAFKDCSLDLLHRYRYFFNHPVQMQAQLYPVDNIERQDAQVIPADKDSESKPTTSRFMQQVLKSLVVISHYMVTTLVILTEANVILKERDDKWPFGNTIVYPDMQIPISKSTSFGTLVECITAGTSMLTQAQKDHQAPELANFIQSCAVLLTSQVALWVTKPEMQQDMRMEIGQESVTDIVDCLVKTEAALKKLNTTTNNLESKIKLIQTLQVFLGNRYYRK